jgi:hypothetical protein
MKSPELLVLLKGLVLVVVSHVVGVQIQKNFKSD